jgi:hypothetical protein
MSIGISYLVEKPYIVLYQKWPEIERKFFEITEVQGATTMVDSFPATNKGLQAAIDKAVRKDAKLVKMEHPFFSVTEMLKAVEEKIKKKKFIYLFQPLQKVEEIK